MGDMVMASVTDLTFLIFAVACLYAAFRVVQPEEAHTTILTAVVAVVVAFMLTVATGLLRMGVEYALRAM